MGGTIRRATGAAVLAMAMVATLGSMARAEDKRMERTITVSASGEVAAEPDMARIQSGVTTEAATARDALAGNSAAMRKVIDGLKSRGIDPKDIQTSSFRVEPRGVCRILRVELLQCAIHIDPVVEIARRLPDQPAQVERDLLMRQRRVKPLLIGRHCGPHGTEEKRLSVAARDGQRLRRPPEPLADRVHPGARRGLPGERPHPSDHGRPRDPPLRRQLEPGAQRVGAPAQHVGRPGGLA